MGMYRHRTCAFRAMSGLFVAWLFVNTTSYGCADGTSLQPGLIAEYRSLVNADANISRIDAKPAFTLGYSSPHPRLPAGPFEVVWTGLLLLTDPGPIIFD